MDGFGEALPENPFQILQHGAYHQAGVNMIHIQATDNRLAQRTADLHVEPVPDQHRLTVMRSIETPQTVIIEKNFEATVARQCYLQRTGSRRNASRA